MQLSVCIITKNECTKLNKCLNALKPYGFEIVVVDTGSTDLTKNMVLEYTDKLFSFDWTDDFAAAKNYAVSKASNDMVMVIDSDEYMEKCNLKVLFSQIEANPYSVGRIKRINLVSRNGETIENIDWTNRIFNRKLFQYRGKIHEQLVPIHSSDRGDEVKIAYEMYKSELVVRHDGYEGTEEERRRKAERNVRLLIKELKETPEDTYLLYQLGKSYYMAGEYEKAVENFDIALQYDVDPKLE